MFSIYIYVPYMHQKRSLESPLRGIYEGPILLTPEQQQKQGCGREV